MITGTAAAPRSRPPSDGLSQSGKGGSPEGRLGSPQHPQERGRDHRDDRRKQRVERQVLRNERILGRVREKGSPAFGRYQSHFICSVAFATDGVSVAARTASSASPARIDRRMEATRGIPSRGSLGRRSGARDLSTASPERRDRAL